MLFCNNAVVGSLASVFASITHTILTVFLPKKFCIRANDNSFWIFWLCKELFIFPNITLFKWIDIFEFVVKALAPIYISSFVNPSLLFSNRTNFNDLQP